MSQRITTQDALGSRLPASVDTEKALLGAMIISKDAAVSAIALVRATDFFLDSHRRIFRAIEQMYSESKVVDLVTLVGFLTASAQIDSVGGAAYVSALIDGVPRSSNVSGYASIVREQARLRELVRLGEQLRCASLEGVDPSSGIIERSVSSLLRVGMDDAGESQPRPWSEVSAKAYRELEYAARNPDKATRFRCSCTDLNEFTGELRTQELNVIVGMTSHGKTALAEDYVDHAAVRGMPTQVFSAEMTAESLALRQMARTAGIRPSYMRRPELLLSRLGEQGLERIREQSGKELPVWIVDRKITPSRVRATAEAMKRLHDIKLLVVDYDQLVVGASAPQDEFAAQAQFIREALEIAKRLELCYLLLAQPRKVDIEVYEGKRPPRLEDIFGRSAVANTAHIVMWVMREFWMHKMAKEFERKGKIYVLKNRNGATGVVAAEFNTDRLRWEDAPPSEYDSVTEPTEPKRGSRSFGNTTSTYVEPPRLDLDSGE